MFAKKWKSLATAALIAFLPLSALAVEPRLEKKGNEVRSFEPPAVVSVPKDALYLGNKRWVLYGYADCDLHLYAEKDAQGVVTRLYWVQSEGYIPNRPELTHAGGYDKSRKTTLGGLDIHLDTWARNIKDAAPANSDLEQVERLIAENKLTLPADMAFVRWVHLPDKAQRKELMIIYAERIAAGKASSVQEEKALRNAKTRIHILKKRSARGM